MADTKPSPDTDSGRNSPAQDWTLRGAIILILAVIIGLPLLLEPKAQAVDADGPRLVIVTPHNEQIRFEIEQAFNRHREAQGLSPVRFDWRTSGGTSDLRKQIIAEFEAEARQALEEGRDIEGVGYDLFFGGGEYDHNKLAAKSVVQTPVDGQMRSIRYHISVPPKLPAGLLAQAFPEPTIAGERLIHQDRRWIGTALSSFGIVYNRDVLAMLELPEPTTWRDLQAPAYFQWIALADPAHSGSISATYNAILMRLGWAKGWSVLRRIFANSRYFASSASKVPVDVSQGEAAAGMCIDFYGRFQSQAIDKRRVGYVDPKRMTATTADPISLIRDGPNQQLAESFIAWTISKPGQRLWQRRVDTPDGPVKFELRRLPVRRDLYTEQEMSYWTDPVNPFREVAAPFPEAMPSMFATVAIVSHAMAIDVHDELKAAWRAILDNPEHPNREAMLQAFNAMPEPLTLRWPSDDFAENWSRYLQDPDHPKHDAAARTLNGFIDGLSQRWARDRDQRETDRVEWARFFRRQYAQVVRLSR